MHQRTLRKPCEITGIGLHTGRRARMVIHPAKAGQGIVFRLKDQGKTVELPARAEFVTKTDLSTTLGHQGLEVRTVEHLMAALMGLGIDNALVEVEGSEVPVLDGSAEPFVEQLRQVGWNTLPESRRMIRVLAPVEVAENGKFAGLYPADTTVFRFQIDFAHPAIQQQNKAVALTPQNFTREIAKARTFGFHADLEKLHQAGHALGASLDNAVGLGPDGQVLNAGGLRYADEFVRHKILDAIGDLALAGLPILGEYRGVKSGHAMNHKLVTALLANPNAYEVVTLQGFPKAQAV